MPGDSAQEQGGSSGSLHAREDGSRKGEYQGLNEPGEFQRREEERSRLPGEFARPILKNEGLQPGSLTAGGVGLARRRKLKMSTSTAISPARKRI